MASVTYNGQSFSIDGRRFWILGASIQYARVPAALWSDRIAAARQAGFNTIETACPWMIHEPRKGRFAFQGDADVRRFLELCAAAGMRVMLRIGPYIGSQFDAGGLPGWLIETPGVMVREANELFLEHVSRYFRKLLGEIADLQATQGGPMLLMQSEHAWDSTNDDQADRYLGEVTRFIRENGITIPITNANDLWQASPDTIDTWRGKQELLIHLRQLRSVQQAAPRVVSAFDGAGVDTWGGSGWGGKRGDGSAEIEGRWSALAPQVMLHRLAEILAAGAQPVVSPFHAGTNFGFLGGRTAGVGGGFVATSAAADPPLGEAGDRSEKYHLIRRLITFARSFGHVFADLDPDYHPIVLDPDEVTVHPSADSRRRERAESSVSVVSMRGAQGRVVFVFAGEAVRDSSLLLDDGVRLPVHLGMQSVGWFLLDVDLQGSGRLDYANVSPWAIVDRSIAVFFGPEKASAYLSIGGTPLEAVIPVGDGKPLVLEHRGVTVVLCNHSQLDTAYHDDRAVYFGVSGFDRDGKPLPLDGGGKAWVIRKDASIEPLDFAAAGSGKTSPRRSSGSGSASATFHEWSAATCAPYCTGESPRYASLEGPESLGNCGAPFGYGWYRFEFNSSSAGKSLCHLPNAADRLHLYAHGSLNHIFGVGPGAQSGPFDLRLERGANVVSVLADNLGRFSEGNEIGVHKGVDGHLFAVKEIRTGRPKVSQGRPVDPFTLRGFIAERAAGQMSDTTQAIWVFNHTKKLPVLIDVIGAKASGTFVLNDHPIEYYSGLGGGMVTRILIDPRMSKHFRRGNNTLRFAPDLRQENAADDVIKHTTIYECTDVLTENAAWAFAKWEPPAASTFQPFAKADARSLRGQPCWWRAQFGVEVHEAELPRTAFWLDVSGLSKGQAYINGQNLGRYFTAIPTSLAGGTGEGKPVGRQTRLYVPGVWLKPSSTERPHNEIVLFDEHGFDPGRVRLTRG